MDTRSPTLDTILLRIIIWHYAIKIILNVKF